MFTVNAHALLCGNLLINNTQLARLDGRAPNPAWPSAQQAGVLTIQQPHPT